MAGLARNLLLIAVALGVALAATEALLAARGFAFSFAPERVEFGWPNPKILTERFERDPDLLWVTRGYAGQIARAASDPPDIVFQGDSTTEMGRYPSDFVRRANALAASRAIRGEKIGVSGWSSYQGLLQMQRDVVAIAPRFVTVYFGWNDHWIGFGVEDADIHAITRSPLARVQSFRTGQLLMKAHYVWRTGSDPVEYRVDAADFAQNLRQMLATARDHGIVPVLLTAPSSHQRGREPAYLGQRWLRDLSQLVPLHERYVEIVRQVADEQQAPICDLARDFSALPPQRVHNEYFMADGIHLTPAGDDQIAAFLIRCFRDHGELKTLWEPAS